MTERRTRQRDAIRSAFERADRPLTAVECLELASGEVRGLGQATVYRTIKRLVATGWLRAVALPDGPDRFEVSGKQHHHHFHCRTCDGVFEVPACPGGFAAMAPPGFHLENHEVILYGVCEGCGEVST